MSYTLTVSMDGLNDLFIYLFPYWSISIVCDTISTGLCVSTVCGQQGYTHRSNRNDTHPPLTCVPPSMWCVPHLWTTLYGVCPSSPPVWTLLLHSSLYPPPPWTLCPSSMDTHLHPSTLPLHIPNSVFKC